MYKVILVDDEPFITDGLKKIIDWNSYNLDVIGIASTGDELLTLFNADPADIIITDINMPNINGLKIIETIKKINSDVKFIILSGYDDFNYVREGMMLGIENYLLKPINEQELMLTLKSTVRKIERTVNIENFLKDDFNVLKDNILYRWTTNNIDYQELLDRSELLKINLDYQYYIVTCIKILFTSNQDSQYFNKETSKIVSSLYSVCNKLIKSDPSYMCFCDSENNIVIITGTNHKNLMEKCLNETLNNIINESKSKLSLDTFITVGDIQISQSNMHVSYSRAIQIQDYMLILPANNIIYYNKVIDINKKNTIKQELNLEGFKKILSSNDNDKTFNFIDNFFGKLKNYNYITPSDVQNYTIEIMLLIIKHSDEMGIVSTTSTKDYRIFFSSLFKIHNINKLKEELKKQITKLNLNTEIKDNKLSPVIKQILNYVNLNYNKDLCLKSLSASYNINAAYLGQLFQKEIGESFSEFVNNLRMEKSKELLMTTNLKNSEIAAAIGFYDSNYFYRKFKEHFKTSPSEFRMTVNNS